MKDREVEYKYIVSCENSQMKSYLTFVICSKRGAKCFLAHDVYRRQQLLSVVKTFVLTFFSSLPTDEEK